MANVQISQELFLDLFRYFNLQEHDEDIFQKCKLQLEQKVDSIVKREIYTKYKTAATAEEREKARQEYLDKIGMNEDWRY